MSPRLISVRQRMAGVYLSLVRRRKSERIHCRYIRTHALFDPNKNGLLLTVLGVISPLSASGCAENGHFCF
jgi:hypothetical protein